MVLKDAIRRAQENLLHLQSEDGYWQGELLVDSTLCSDTIQYLHWSGRHDEILQERCAEHIRARQLPDGGWNIYEGGPSEINASVKAYFALKLSGDSQADPRMKKARANILRLGGIPCMNTYAKLYLALLGQFPWKFLPTLPVELFLLPSWFPFNVYEMSSWSRAMIAPLALLNHFKPTRTLPPHLHLHELYPAGMEGTDLSLRQDPQFWTWRNFFLRCDSFLKIYDRFPIQSLRRHALTVARQWMIERMGNGSEGLAAIFPAMLNSLMALQALGTPAEDPIFQKAEQDFRGLFVETGDDFRIQPCLSPVWDTAITAISLAESGLSSSHSALQAAGRWLEKREVRFRGDWAQKISAEASGWAFEHENKYYPDTDDTMMVLMALRLIATDQPEVRNACMSRGLRWLLSFQCKDGGWAAFDRDITQTWLEDVPFADHNAILDPSCSDLTARMLELLGKIGWKKTARESNSAESALIRNAIGFLRRTQESDGSWYGRWGVNYIYGTWQVLRGLEAIGMDMQQSWIQHGRNWLESCQNPDGGWGETCASYEDPTLKGKGPSTASQTAWALMGLCACGDFTRVSILRGIQWLIRHQNPDGSWTENATTGTGFPKVFYLKYDLYRNNWPLLALATYQKGIIRLSAENFSPNL
ncbi:MAG: squalene--hopene cyclase [Verrucomicrobia bacterium]|nr:MAG: squalene--hopene cyclase [Verrucomicrobiota bacterium]